MQTDFAVRGKEKQMDDFILRKAALDSLCSGCEYVPIEEKENCPYRFTGCQEYANIFAIPAADVRPVVTCGECKHWFRIKKDCVLASCELDSLVRSEDFFCAAGEREVEHD